MGGENAAAEEPLPGDTGVLRFTLHGEDVERPVFLGVLQADVYARWLRILNATGDPYAIGGAFAVYAYTGAWRDSKDLDIFLRPQDLKAALDALQAAGFETEVRDRLWLAKVHHPPVFMDLLFAIRHTSSLRVTADWFSTCRPAQLLGVPTRILGIEEIIATKVYLAARERFDGADIVHLIRAGRGRLDWERIVHLLHGDEEILLWHLMLFQLVYPGLVDQLPQDLMRRAIGQLEAGWAEPPERRTFRGSLLDPRSFAVDVRDWGFRDEREHKALVDHDGAAM